MDGRLELSLCNDFSALGPASQQVREHLGQCGAPGEAAFLADLVIEELVTNTIKYGYDDEAGHAIHICVAFDSGKLCIEVRDQGRHFDPLTLDSPDVTLSAEERDIGGLGIHLVREMSDTVAYERAGAENIVTVTKTFPPAPGAGNP